MALRKTTDKRVRFQMHASNLQTYISSGFTPKGLRVQLKPAMSTFNKNEQEQWSNILKDASLKLTQVVIAHSTCRAAELQKEEQARLNHSSLTQLETEELVKYEE